jgi:hypothetical protein
MQSGCLSQLLLFIRSLTYQLTTKTAWWKNKAAVKCSIFSTAGIFCIVLPTEQWLYEVRSKTVNIKTFGLSVCYANGFYPSTSMRLSRVEKGNKWKVRRGAGGFTVGKVTTKCTIQKVACRRLPSAGSISFSHWYFSDSWWIVVSCSTESWCTAKLNVDRKPQRDRVP